MSEISAEDIGALNGILEGQQDIEVDIPEITWTRHLTTCSQFGAIDGRQLFELRNPDCLDSCYIWEQLAHGPSLSGPHGTDPKEAKALCRDFYRSWLQARSAGSQVLSLAEGYPGLAVVPTSNDNISWERVSDNVFLGKGSGFSYMIREHGTYRDAVLTTADQDRVPLDKRDLFLCLDDASMAFTVANFLELSGLIQSTRK